MSEPELKQIDKKVAHELEPFLNRIRMKKANRQLFKKALLDFKERIGRSAKIVLWLNEEYQKTRSEVYQAFMYLGTVESLGNVIVNLVVMLLVANGIDFHIQCQYTTPRIKHAMTIGELEKERVPLTTKLNFLRDNGLKTFSSLVDSRLRNVIAHLKFDIEDSNIFINGKPVPELLTNSSLKTIEALMVAETSIRELAEQEGLI